jgi:repressor LexA
MDDVTARQRRIIEFIKGTVRERGYPPTVREIGEAVGLTSSSSVHAQLANLERRGLLRRDPTKPRAMELQGPDGRSVAAVNIPVLGRISAGAPTLAADDVEAYLAVPMDYTGDGGVGHFALRVRGDSMIQAGILDGDTVVVRSQDSADDGDVVVALLPGTAEDEATVKRLRGRGERAMLVPENPAMEPFPLGEGVVIGKVVAVLRKL